MAEKENKFGAAAWFMKANGPIDPKDIPQDDHPDANALKRIEDANLHEPDRIAAATKFKLENAAANKNEAVN